VHEVSIGGGWAEAYRPGDRRLEPASVARALARSQLKLDAFQLAVEPGRWLVARAAVAVYRVGSVKTSGAGRIIAVDGGMGDNPRPALYGARYYACAADREPVFAVGRADVVGRFCESGDVLAPDVPLPSMASGDLMCVPVSGAYQLSMASAYNLVPQPAAVMVRDGNARLIMRRATLDELLNRDVDPV
jgi:diaminopimelate decarboxylase